MQDKKHIPDIQFILIIVVLDAFYLLGSIAIDAKLNNGGNQTLMIYLIGGFFLTTSILGIVSFKLSKRHLFWLGVFSATSLINLLFGLTISLSLPVLMNIKGTYAFYTTIGLTIFAWIHQFYSTFNSREIQQEIVHTIQKKINFQKRPSKFKDKPRINKTGLDFVLPAWLEPLRGVMSIILVTSMLVGLNLQKLFPVAAGLMWTIPLLIVSSICAVLVARLFIWYKECKRDGNLFSNL